MTPPRRLPILGHIETRMDAQGSGLFGAGRGARRHMGHDLIAAPGTEVFSPMDGVIRQIAPAYAATAIASDPRLKAFTAIHILGADAREYVLRYVAPRAEDRQRLWARQLIKAGEMIGLVQDRAALSPGMQNHLHFEIREGPSRRALDPGPLVAEWIAAQSEADRQGKAGAERAV